MIAPVAVCSTALTDSAGLAGELLTMRRRELVERLFAHGELVFADERAEEDFRGALGALARVSPTVAASWTELLKLKRHRLLAVAPERQLEQVRTVDALQPWDTEVDVAVLQRQRAHELGHPPDNVSWTPPGSRIEITSHDRAAACRTLTELDWMARSYSIQIGSSRETLWVQRMAPLVRVARHIHLQDRFLGEGLLNAERAARDAPARRGQWLLERVGGEPQETEWLLQRIAEAAPADASLTLYACFSRADERRQMERAFARAVSTFVPADSGITRVKLQLVPRARWDTDQAHDRHLRADACGIEISTGFDRLARSRVRSRTTVVYMHGPNLSKLKAAERMVAELGVAPIGLR